MDNALLKRSDYDQLRSLVIFVLVEAESALKNIGKTNDKGLIYAETEAIVKYLNRVLDVAQPEGVSTTLAAASAATEETAGAGVSQKRPLKFKDIDLSDLEESVGKWGEALIKQVSGCRTIYEKDYAGGSDSFVNEAQATGHIARACNDLIGRICDLAKIQAAAPVAQAPAAGQWVSVAERLPERNTQVWAAFLNHGKQTVRRAFYRPDGYWDEFIAESITHWQLYYVPEPAAPQPVKGESHV